MSNRGTDNFVRCHEGIQRVCMAFIPCIQKILEVWHQHLQSTMSVCTTPQTCPNKGKPRSAKGSCQACVYWANALESAVFPPSPSGSLPWSNINPTLLHKDPVEAAKIFVLRLQPGTYSDVGDFDTASLLMIMMKFKEFNQGNYLEYGTIKKVSDIRNNLAHMKVNKDLKLDDQTTDDYFKDMSDLITCINHMHPQYCTQDDTTNVLQTLTDIRKSPVTKRLTDEVLKPFSAAMEQVVRETIHDVLKTSPTMSTDPGIDHCSMTENPFDVDVCVAELKRVYNDEKGKISLLPFDEEGLENIEDIFVPLELHQEVSVRFNIKTVLNHYGDLFNLEKNGNPVLRVLVKGGPGCGKTTLSSKIAYDWAQGVSQEGLSIGLDKFQLLFLLNMRLVDQAMTLVDAIFDQLIPYDSQISKDALEGYIVQNADKVAIILDGADEFTGKIVTSRIGKLVVDVVCNRLLCNSCVIVTTRPHMLSTVKEFSQQYTQVQVEGFTDKNVLKFISRFFKVSTYNCVHEVARARLQVPKHDPSEMTSPKSKKESIDSFIQAIYQSKTLWHISRIPLIITMLCLLWEEAQELPKRLTGVYQQAMHYFTQRWLEKDGSWYDPDDGTEDEEMESIILTELGQLAFSGLLQDRLFFTEKEFQSADVLEKACSIGILQQERKRSKLHVVKQFSFFNKTFQEFSAASYLASLVDKSVDELSRYLNRVHSSNVESLEYVLLFCCGLNAKAAGLIISHLVDIRSHDVLVGESCQMFLRSNMSWLLGMRLLYESQCPQCVTHFKRWFVCQFIELGIPTHPNNDHSDALSKLDYFIDCFKEYLSVNPEGTYSMLVPDHRDTRSPFKPGDLLRDNVILKYLSELVILLLEYAKERVVLHCVLQHDDLFRKDHDHDDEIGMISKLLGKLSSKPFQELRISFSKANGRIGSCKCRRHEYEWKDVDIKSAQLLEKDFFRLGCCIGRLTFDLCLSIHRETSVPRDISPLLNGITSSSGASTPIRGFELSDCGFTTDAMVAFLSKSKLHTLALTITPGSVHFHTRKAEGGNKHDKGARVMPLCIPTILKAISSGLSKLHIDICHSKLSLQSPEYHIEQLFPGLTCLHLQYSNDTILFWKSLMRRKVAKLDNSIRSFSLEGCAIGGLITIPQLPVPVYLIKSEVRQHTIKRSMIGVFQWLQDAVALTDVCSVDKTEDPLISALKNMPLLEHLNLSATGMTPSDIDVLADELRGCKHLKTLQLSNNVIGQACVGLSKTLGSIPNMTTLCLKHTKLGNRGVEALANSFQSMRNLESLDITGNSISFKGTYQMSLSLHHLHRLSSLNICSNPISDLGMLALCNSFKGIPRLEYLYLNNCDLRSPAALLLALSFKFLPSLSTLHVAYNKQLGAIGVGWLLENIGVAKNLTVIDLYGTTLSQANFRMTQVVETSEGETKRLLAVSTSMEDIGLPAVSKKLTIQHFNSGMCAIFVRGYGFLSPPYEFLGSIFGSLPVITRRSCFDWDYI